MNSSTILQHRENMASYLELKKSQGAFDDPKHVSEGGTGLVGKGMGMVFTAGNADTLRRVVWTLDLIRKREFFCFFTLMFQIILFIIVFVSLTMGGTIRLQLDSTCIHFPFPIRSPCRR